MPASPNVASRRAVGVEADDRDVEVAGGVAVGGGVVLERAGDDDLAVVLDDQAACDLGAAAAFGDVDRGGAAVAERGVGRAVGVEAGHGEHVVVADGREARRRRCRPSGPSTHGDEAVVVGVGLRQWPGRRRCRTTRRGPDLPLGASVGRGRRPPAASVVAASVAAGSVVGGSVGGGGSVPAVAVAGGAVSSAASSSSLEQAEIARSDGDEAARIFFLFTTGPSGGKCV